jgi:hypothetical protein
MKQISYEFNIRELASGLISNVDLSPEGVRPHLEDGYWEPAFQFETVSPVILPPMVQGQLIETLPGVLIRLAGIKMVKVPTLGPISIEIRNGQVVPNRSESDGIDRDNNGSVESIESTGENS